MHYSKESLISIGPCAPVQYRTVVVAADPLTIPKSTICPLPRRAEVAQAQRQKWGTQVHVHYSAPPDDSRSPKLPSLQRHGQ